MKKSLCFLTAFVMCSFSFFAQGITTASEFFKSVSNTYATFKDYTASLKIQIDQEEMEANVLYMAPNKMRIDFTVPENQTMVFDGNKLVCYIPDASSVLTQDGVSSNPTTSEGLSLLRRYYSVSYETGPDAENLDEESDEQVVKLIFWRRSATESFRNIKIAVNPETNMIRRIVAVTPLNVTYTFDFSNYEINTGLTDKRFMYDIPSGANNYDNFLFSQ